MKQMFYRVLAYLIAGALLGFASWLVLSAQLLPAKMPYLSIAALAIGGIIVAIIFIRLAATGSKRGIRVNSAIAVAMMDSVCIIAATIVSLFVIDGNSSLFSGDGPLIMVDPLALDVVVFMYLPSTLVLAAFVTSSGGQFVCIDEKGIAISGAFISGITTWNGIRKISPHEQYVMVSRVGIPIPRHLRTNLEITLEDDEGLTVVQPEFRSVKIQILDRLKEYAPARLQKDLGAIGAAWLS